jgi:hypothetical protein
VHITSTIVGQSASRIQLQEASDYIDIKTKLITSVVADVVRKLMWAWDEVLLYFEHEVAG